jgi:hypothetical protein
VIRFPYKPLLVHGTRAGTYATVFRPMIPIHLFGPAGRHELTGMVDTGADDTLIPERFIGRLGVVILPGDYAATGGIEGSMALVRYGTIDLAIPGAGGDYRWSAKVGFHAGEKVVLGHGGFLEYFTANFNGRGRHLTLTPNGNARPSIFP